jgi:hypothetical protein
VPAEDDADAHDAADNQDRHRHDVLTLGQGEDADQGADSEDRQLEAVVRWWLDGRILCVGGARLVSNRTSAADRHV